MVKKASSLSALGGLVYSTDSGRHCPDCNQPVGACICKQAEIPAGDGIARVRRETKGRGGKTVTTVTGVPLAADALEVLKHVARLWGFGVQLESVSGDGELPVLLHSVPAPPVEVRVALVMPAPPLTLTAAEPVAMPPSRAMLAAVAAAA